MSDLWNPDFGGDEEAMLCLKIVSTVNQILLISILDACQK
jgi:hypothetical protein